MAKKGKADRHRDHARVHRVPRAKLHDREEPPQRSVAARVEEVLPALPRASACIARRASARRLSASRHDLGLVAQLVEQRSPKPQVAGSSPVGPARWWSGEADGRGRDHGGTPPKSVR